MAFTAGIGIHMSIPAVCLWCACEKQTVYGGRFAFFFCHCAIRSSMGVIVQHYTEVALYEAAVRYLDELKVAGEPITPKKWRREVDTLTAKKNLQYQQMRAMRDELKGVEKLKKTAVQLARSEQTRKQEPEL